MAELLLELTSSGMHACVRFLRVSSHRYKVCDNFTWGHIWLSEIPKLVLAEVLAC